ncbi:DNA cytosine methyltransferase [Paenibacillus endoradicis]|uniref:DNA cytosine methyltransferase n=1 Tax=Paenibacillus endoradicis TaxID=2972487 RepID=UPI0021595D92|nr:DNA cytosine methyltransferase [Paenibacillus endoradicis]MCR8657807.1 DNA cytosine methyltransferase [Paenibacillus endoradicis]
MSEKKLTAVDLFSGAGGMSVGFMQTGLIDVVASIENNESAKKTYQHNHRTFNTDNKIKFYSDIRNVNFRQEILASYPKIDIVFGGPPCQGFSNANRQKTNLISMNNQLVKEYVRAIEELNPSSFVMENVKAMQSKKHKFFYSKQEHKEIVEILKLDLFSEKLILGNKSLGTFEIMGFLLENLEVESLRDYIIIDKLLYSKLTQIVKKPNEAKEYIKRNERILTRSINNWEAMHNKYWSITFKEQWLELGDLLNQSDRSDETLLKIIDIIKEIVEIEKIMMRMNEILNNGIEVSTISIKDSDLIIDVKSYNVMDYLLAKFNYLGYRTNSEYILNAASFGAPQMRERLVLIGVKMNIIGDSPVVLPTPIFKDNQYFTVRDAIYDLEHITPFTSIEAERAISKTKYVNENLLLRYLSSDTKTVRNHMMTNTTDTALSRFKALQQGQNFHDLEESYKLSYADPDRTQNSVYFRLRYDRPSNTVINARKSMWIHPSKDRAISIREVARLQTFPDDFVFIGSKDSQYQQIGNAVPPILGRAIAEKILYYLGINVSLKLSDILKTKYL